VRDIVFYANDLTQGDGGQVRMGAVVGTMACPAVRPGCEYATLGAGQARGRRRATTGTQP